MTAKRNQVVAVRFNGSTASARRLAASVAKAASRLFSRSRTKWAVRAFGLLSVLAVAGCCAHREGDIVMKGGDAYVFTKTLTREQIAEGKEIERLWLAYYNLTNPRK